MKNNFHSYIAVNKIEMKSIISFLFHLQAFMTIVDQATARRLPDSNVFRCRNGTGKTSDEYRKNIKMAVDAVASKIATNSGFYHSSYGKTETVNAVALCPGYISPDVCAKCVKESTSLLEQKCPTQKEGVAWIAECMVRYSDRKILGVLDDWVWVSVPGVGVVARAAEMEKAVNTLATRLQGQASKGNSRQKYAYGSIDYGPGGMGGYGLNAALQCTPDLPMAQCAKCLFSAILTVHPCCSGKDSASLLSPNCYLKYDHYKLG